MRDLIRETGKRGCVNATYKGATASTFTLRVEYAISKFQGTSLRAQPGDYFREIYCVSRFARVSTTLKMTGRNFGILRSRIQPVE